MKEQLEKIEEKAPRQIESSEVLEELNDIRVSYPGKKGELTNLLKSTKDVAPGDRSEVDQTVNNARGLIEGRLKGARTTPVKRTREEQLKREVIDVTFPTGKNSVDHSHPNTIALEEVERISVGMGYEVMEGPEVGYDRYNFKKLSIPKSHPARDKQDTFYINENVPLRSQTSPVQARTMEQGKFPIRMIAPDRTSHSDEADITHSPFFHQIEGLMIDRNITFTGLRGTLAEFARELFGPETRVEFRLHHFPFTEPSAEVDVTCFKHGGSDCRFCKGSGWIEILGCGMVYPHVLEMCGTDPDVYSGFASGVELERIASLKYEVGDMRLLYEDDVRLLKQL